MRQGTNLESGPEIDDPQLSDGELRNFFLQLSVMLSSGIPILRCFETLSSDAFPKVGFLSNRLLRTVSAGHPLSRAFRQFRLSFDQVIVSLIAVGENTGKLELILRELAKRVDQRCKFRQRLIQAAIYPAMVVAVSFALIALLSHSMLPVLLDFASGLQTEIPWPTKVLLFFVEAKWITGLLLGLLLLVLADLTWGLREETSEFRNWVLYQSPVLGALNSQRLFLNLCNDLALMLEAGCLLTQALASLSPTCPDPRVSRVLLCVRNDIQNGESLEEALEGYDVIPRLISSSLAVGSEVGRREALLRTVASLIESDLETRIDRLTALIEPLTMAILGLVVGGILLASLLPIYAVVSDGL